MPQRKRVPKPLEDELADQLDFLVRDTRLRMYRIIERRIAGTGIPLRIWFPLRALYRRQGITQRELGRMLGFGDAHAGVIVRAMERRRLVYRQPSRIDKRRIDLFLTPAGRAMARLTLRHMRWVNDRIAAGLRPAEIGAFRALLARVRANLEA